MLPVGVNVVFFFLIHHVQMMTKGKNRVGKYYLSTYSMRLCSVICIKMLCRSN